MITLDLGVNVGRHIRLNTSTFDNNLSSTITNVQKLAEAVDDLITSGAVSPVKHTLAAMTGWGIVPAATVADITARDAWTPTGNNWIEVTASDHDLNDTRLYHWDGSKYVGPFAISIKNAPYIGGANNESILEVSDALLPDDQYPSGATYNALTEEEKLSVRRSNELIYVHIIDPACVPVDGYYRVVNKSTSSNKIALVSQIGRSKNAAYNPLDDAVQLSSGFTVSYNPTVLAGSAAIDFGLDEFNQTVPLSYDAGSIFGTTATFAPPVFTSTSKPKLLLTDKIGGTTYYDSTDLELRDLYDTDFTGGVNHGDKFVYDSNTSKWIPKSKFIVVNVGSVSGAVNLDCYTGDLFKVTATNDITFTISNSPTVNEIDIELTDAGAYVVAFTNTIEWLYGVAPTFATTGTTRFKLRTLDGTNWFGFYVNTSAPAVTWGSITGTLSNQTDLNNALAAKANLAGATFTGALGVTQNLSGSSNTFTITNTQTATNSASTLSLVSGSSTTSLYVSMASGNPVVWFTTTATSMNFDAPTTFKIRQSASDRIVLNGTSITLSPASSGTVTIGGKGLLLPNADAANSLVFDYMSKNSNFTPVIEGTTTAGTGTYTVQVGKATRIANLVFVSIDIVCTAHTGTGNLRITGLPFQCKTYDCYLQVIPAAVTGDANTHMLHGLVSLNTSYVDIYSQYKDGANLLTYTPVALAAGNTMIKVIGVYNAV